jgi:hypothetical protein
MAVVAGAAAGGGRAAAFDPQPDPPGFELVAGQTAYLVVANLGPGDGRAELYMFDQTDERGDPNLRSEGGDISSPAGPLLAACVADPLPAGERTILALRGDEVAGRAAVFVDPLVQLSAAKGMIIHGSVRLELVDERTGASAILYEYEGSFPDPDR